MLYKPYVDIDSHTQIIHLNVMMPWASDRSVNFLLECHCYKFSDIRTFNCCLLLLMRTGVEYMPKTSGLNCLPVLVRGQRSPIVQNILLWQSPQPYKAKPQYTSFDSHKTITCLNAPVRSYLLYNVYHSLPIQKWNPYSTLLWINDKVLKGICIGLLQRLEPPTFYANSPNFL